MASVNQDFTTYQGNSAAPVFQALDDSGQPLDLTAATEIVWNAQRSLDAGVVLQKTLTGAQIVPLTGSGNTGKFKVLILAADTVALSAYYMHQATISFPDGIVTTVILGRMRVGRPPAASYSGDPSNSVRDAVRFWLGDTDPEKPYLTDPEIDQLVKVYANPIRAAAAGARRIATAFASKANKRVGDFSINYSDISKQWSAIAAQLEAQGATMGLAPYSGGISKSDIARVAANVDRVKPPFRRDQFDNPDGFNNFNSPGWDDCSGQGPS